MSDVGRSVACASTAGYLPPRRRLVGVRAVERRVGSTLTRDRRLSAVSTVPRMSFTTSVIARQWGQEPHQRSRRPFISRLSFFSSHSLVVRPVPFDAPPRHTARPPFSGPVRNPRIRPSVIINNDFDGVDADSLDFSSYTIVRQKPRNQTRRQLHCVRVPAQSSTSVGHASTSAPSSTAGVVCENPRPLYTTGVLHSKHTICIWSLNYFIRTLD